MSTRRCPTRRQHSRQIHEHGSITSATTVIDVHMATARPEEKKAKSRYSHCSHGCHSQDRSRSEWSSRYGQAYDASPRRKLSSQCNSTHPRQVGTVTVTDGQYCLQRVQCATLTITKYKPKDATVYLENGIFSFPKKTVVKVLDKHMINRPVSDVISSTSRSTPLGKVRMNSSLWRAFERQSEMISPCR